MEKVVAQKGGAFIEIKAGILDIIMALTDPLITSVVYYVEGGDMYSFQKNENNEWVRVFMRKF